jgi:FKBP-type peptidyl-prolyl cis-trans isomerase FklB
VGAFFISTPMSKLLISTFLLLLFLVACQVKKSSYVSDASPSLENRIPSGDTIHLPSGLSYKVIKYGVGKTPKATSKVRVHYEGTLVDGTVFDSSIQRGKPLVFRLNQVIQGWQEGLLLMKEGAVYELYIPPKLGYGSQSSGKIPPFSTLYFTVELLEVI